MSALEKLEEALFRHLDEAEAECAALIEQAHIDAIRQADLRVDAAEKRGIERERQRVLLKIALLLEQLKADGTNALALHQLRREIIDDETSAGDTRPSPYPN